MSKGRRPRCHYCRKRKQMRGEWVCWRCKDEYDRTERFWEWFTGQLVKWYEQETGQIQVAGSEGWKTWLRTRIFERPSRCATTPETLPGRSV